MQLQLITLCDSASDYQGKLCVLGTFDTICANDFPVVHPQCSLALRLICNPHDVGQHQVLIELKNEEGTPIMPLFNPTIEVNFPPGAVPFVSRNLVLNLQRLQFEKPGLYHFIVSIDDEELSSLPLRVTHFEHLRGANHPSG